MYPKVNISMVHGRTISTTNIFLKLCNLSLALDLRNIEFTLLFQSLSLQDQRLDNKNYPISHILNILKNISETFVSLFQRPIVGGGNLRL